MDFQMLKYFNIIVEKESISKAAKMLHITQSALSQMISNMEAFMGVKLFLRSNRGVKATKEGLIFYEYAKKMLGDYERMMCTIRAPKDS